VKVTDKNDPDSFGTATVVVTVNNAPPLVGAEPGELDQEIATGDTAFINVPFSDPGGTDTHTAEINWGDGTVEPGTVEYGSITVTGSHVYDSSGEYGAIVTLTDSDGDSGTATFTITVTGIELLSASYDVPTTTLRLIFRHPVDPDLTDFDKIGMEVDDSGKRDFQLSNARGLEAKIAPLDVEAGGEILAVGTEVTIDIKRDHVTTVNLAVAALVNHHEIDLLLELGAFSDPDGNQNIAIVETDDMPLPTNAGGLSLGTVGDVSGNGEVTAYDAALILRASVGNPEEEFPISSVAEEINRQLAAYAPDYDVVISTADWDGSGYLDAYDAAGVLRSSAGLPSLAPTFGSSAKKGKLSVNSYDDGKLDVSVDLDDVSDIYSVDIVMTYDPSALTVADVSKTSSVSEWLSAEHMESGKLKIALAGASQPVMDGSLITISLDVGEHADAIKQLDITEFKLNGGRLKAAIENLPKAFALLQNYPNPFNPETWIPYRLSEPAEVSITIYNVNGQMVRRLDLGSKMPGHYADKSRAAYWDGRNESGERVSSGIYFYQLQADRDASVGKMILVK
jgi:hypothetical protein